MKDDSRYRRRRGRAQIWPRSLWANTRSCDLDASSNGRDTARPSGYAGTKAVAHLEAARGRFGKTTIATKTREASQRTGSTLVGVRIVESRGRSRGRLRADRKTGDAEAKAGTISQNGESEGDDGRDV